MFQKFFIYIFSLSLIFLANPHIHAASTYVEGQVNYTQIDDVENSGNTGLGGYTLNNYRGNNKYESDTNLGFEFGAKDISDTNVRVALSYSKTKIKLKSISGSGTISDGTNTLDLNINATRAGVESVGFTFDNDVKAYSLNAYYDFETNSNFIPYLGFGLGQVDIENANDKEISKSLYVGGKRLVNDQMYVGLKGAYTMIDGPSDKIGLTYEDITLKTLSLIVGYNF